MQSCWKWLYGVVNLFGFVACFFAKVLISRLVSHRKTRGNPQASATLKFSYFALLDFVFEKCYNSSLKGERDLSLHFYGNPSFGVRGCLPNFVFRYISLLFSLFSSARKSHRFSFRCLQWWLMNFLTFRKVLPRKKPNFTQNFHLKSSKILG